MPLLIFVRFWFRQQVFVLSVLSHPVYDVHRFSQRKQQRGHWHPYSTLRPAVTLNVTKNQDMFDIWADHLESSLQFSFFFLLPSTSLWGFYSSSMHPSITMYTLTHSHFFASVVLSCLCGDFSCSPWFTAERLQSSKHSSIEMTASVHRTAGLGWSNCRQVLWSWCRGNASPF